jgi:hypothetical protein
MKWVESPAHGQGGPDWVEVNTTSFIEGRDIDARFQNHIQSIISVAGTHLVSFSLSVRVCGYSATHDLGPSKCFASI